MQSRPATISFYRRPDNVRARQWEAKLRTWVARKAPKVRVVRGRADLIVVLGGDGTILQAARQHASDSTLIFGINLGTVGFLASVRDERHFLKGLYMVLAGRYRPIRRMMIRVSVHRGKKLLLTTTALNEAYVQNPLGMVRLNVVVNRSSIQQVHGTGILVATPTGSTGYNLSAHGPIVDPSLECLIVTEILDHNIPTPSIVIPADQTITIEIVDARSKVILACDGQAVATLKPGDRVLVQKSEQYITIAEVQANYFTKSLHEKFSLS